MQQLTGWRTKAAPEPLQKQSKHFPVTSRPAYHHAPLLFLHDDELPSGIPYAQGALWLPVYMAHLYPNNALDQ